MEDLIEFVQEMIWFIGFDLSVRDILWIDLKKLLSQERNTKILYFEMLKFS